MRVHIVRHVPFEGPALVAEWAAERGHQLTESLALTEEYPEVGEIDFLVLMGGPMDADDEDASPWLVAEKRYLTDVMSAGRLVLGVCLGAQIIAEVSGGRVRRMDEREIGWYAVFRTAEADSDPVFDSFPESLVVGHWHGDTFDLPDTAWPALSSEACENQAFSVMGGRVVGLQFHLEWDLGQLTTLIEHCEGDLAERGPWVQSPGTIAAGATEYLVPLRAVLFSMLDTMVANLTTAERR